MVQDAFFQGGIVKGDDVFVKAIASLQRILRLRYHGQSPDAGLNSSDSSSASGPDGAAGVPERNDEGDVGTVSYPKGGAAMGCCSNTTRRQRHYLHGITVNEEDANEAVLLKPFSSVNAPAAHNTVSIIPEVPTSNAEMSLWRGLEELHCIR